MRIYVEQQMYGRPPAKCPVASTDLEAGALKLALERYEAAVAREAEKRLERDKLEHKLERAQADDAEAVAAAWEKGSKDPGGKHVEQTRKLIEQTEREFRAAEVAVSRAAEAVNSAWESEGPKAERGLRERLAELADVSSSQLDEWLATFSAMTGIARLLQCGAGFDPQTARPIGWTPYLHAIRVPSFGSGPGTNAAPDAVIEALRSLGRRPAPKPESQQNPHAALLAQQAEAAPAPPPAPERDDLVMVDGALVVC